MNKRDDFTSKVMSRIASSRGKARSKVIRPLKSSPWIFRILFLLVIVFCVLLTIGAYREAVNKPGTLFVLVGALMLVVSTYAFIFLFQFIKKKNKL